MHAFRLFGPVREPSQGDEIPFIKMSCVPGPASTYEMQFARFWMWE